MTGKKKSLGDIHVDSENIDPSLINANASKRKRAVSDDDDKDLPLSKSPSKPLKTSNIALKTVPESSSPPAAPRVSSTPTPKSLSSLKPAGRSPQSSSFTKAVKASCKPFARRSNITKSRPEPASRKSVHRPFSIATALSGSSSNNSSKSTPTATTTSPSIPASWLFDIHVDTEEEEMTNLMQHSTGVLDISDEETKRGTSSTTGRGKENVSPSELGINLPSTTSRQESPAAAARKSVMMDESRAPLGELNAADYYGADCHAFSYVIVYDDDEEEEEGGNAVPVAVAEKKAASTSTRPSRNTKLSSVSSISPLLEPTSPPKPESESEPEPTKTSPDAGIDIWESESAAEEAKAS